MEGNVVVVIGLARSGIAAAEFLARRGAHLGLFVFLYGLRMFALLTALLVSGGVVLALYLPLTFAAGAGITGGLLLTFA